MKSVVGMAALGLVIGVSGLQAQTAPVNPAERISAIGVKKIQIERKDGNFVAQTWIIFKNEGNTEVKFRTMDMAIAFDVKGGMVISREQTDQEILADGKTNKVIRVVEQKTTEILFGQVAEKELVFEKPTEANKGEVVKQMQVMIGPIQGEESFERLRSIFNLISNPDLEFVMKMVGTAKPGMPTASGYYYMPAPIELEMMFKPQVKREVLLK